MRPALVIFDCDGVLVDSERIHVETESAMLAELGWKLSPTQVSERFMGRTATHMLAEIERAIGGPIPPEWLDRMDAVIQQRMDTELATVAGLDEVLAWVDGAGLVAYVATSNTHDAVRRMFVQVGLWERFAGCIVCADDVEHGKPAPDIFLLAAARAGADPDSCVVVEDSPFGLDGARAAAMRTVAYAAGLAPLGELSTRADVVITDLRDLPAAIEGLPD